MSLNDKELFKKRKFRIALVLAIILALSLFLRVHIVRVMSNGSLFWNTEDAYFFVMMDDVGFNFSYLGYVVELVREIYPLGASPSNYTHCSLLVLHVTSSSVQTYKVDNFCSAGIDHFQSTFYSGNMLPDGKLMKWSETHFEPTTAEEQANLQRALLSGRIPPGPSYNDVEGWSKRTVAGQIITKSPNLTVEEDSKVTVEIDGKPLTFIMNSGFISHHAYIDLIRPGQPPERVWQLDESPHRVSRVEYHKIFADEIARKVIQRISAQP